MHTPGKEDGMTRGVQQLAEKLSQEHTLALDEYEELIERRTPEVADFLAQRAVEAREPFYGKKVFTRGLVEISNICKNDCLYCGIRRSNRNLERYRLDPDVIVACAQEGHALGYRTIVLQGGEDGFYTDEVLCDVVSRIARRLLPKRKTEYVAPYSENFTRNEEVLRKGDTYYEGYWQCFDYYKDMKPLLRQTFSHPEPNTYNKGLIQSIKDSSSVGIHIRRGDYKDAPDFNGICTPQYYQKAIATLTADGQKRTFYVFSNDLGWCRQHLPELMKGHDIVYVDGNRGSDSYWDMMLMTYCRELIIANSTFSWWGAFLNSQAATVCAPDPWLRRDCKKELGSEHVSAFPV